MTISYASRDLNWTEPMQTWAARQIAEPLSKLLKTAKFDLSLHWQLARPGTLDQQKYEMWTVLQTYDGHTNRIVRCLGNDFCNLAEDVGESLRRIL